VSVVVIGSGIAGVTAADFIRRGHPDCEIHLVGAHRGGDTHDHDGGHSHDTGLSAVDIRRYRVPLSEIGFTAIEFRTGPYATGILTAVRPN
ncbi:NAD(P)-binding protein, partial [Nocardia sp. NPDC004722]